jgi:signal peptide peptidase SppA
MSSLIDVLQAPWAILPERLCDIRAIFDAHVRGEVLDVAAIELRTGKTLQNEPQGYTIENGVAVVPLQGVLAKRANMFMQISGGASHQMFARDVNAAANDPAARAILIDADTPGGTADGTQLAAAAVRSVRGNKPIAVLADGQLASAGVWIGVQADQVYAIDSGTQVGSIGVVMTHTDISRALDARGVKKTDIVAGRYKRIATEHAALSDEGKAVLQSSIDYLYGLFVNAVADARGTTADAVLERMADGRTFIGAQAVDAGLIDGIATREQVLEDLRDRANSAARTTVSVPPRKPLAQAPAAPVLPPVQRNPMTPEQLEREHPAVAAHFRNLGEQAGLQSGKAAGAVAERERIKGVRAQLMPGHEKLIEQLAADGTTTGPEAAVAVLNAERQIASNRAAALVKDTPPPLPGANNDGTDDDDKPKPKPTRASTHAEAHNLAHLIAAKQAEHAKTGRPITAVQAMALINQEA